MLLDEISTGLDAATTYDIVNSLKSLTRNFKSNIVVSLLQPPPEVFNLFDDVLILNSGRIMYHGPRDQVQEYFERMSFQCPPRKDVADFLLDLGTDKQHAYVSDSHKNVRVPFQSTDFAERFHQSDIFQDTLQYLQAHPMSNPKDFDPLFNPRVFRQSLVEDIKTLLNRQTRIQLRDNVSWLVVPMVIIMGLLYGSTFWQMNDANSQLILGLLFSCTMFLSMGQAPQLPDFMEARSVFYKQRGANFFRSLAYVLASSLTRIPLAVMETIIFGSIVYWMGGYVVLADRFFSFLLISTPRKIRQRIIRPRFLLAHKNVFVRVMTPKAQAPPVTLAFHDLWYSVPLPGGKKGEDIDLLQGVSGFAWPKTMTALMGSSGAGKTTLMDVIAGRKTGGKIRGKILLNGHPATDLAIRRSTGYCEQMDIHSKSATFREALVFSAMLRQSSSVPIEEKMESVEECIDLLELGPIANELIRGSSTEQMKRLTIGVELVAQPSVIFMDEPTSGLDARSAKLIMNARMQSSNLIDYFQATPGVMPIEPGYNPATWMLECIGAGVSGGSSSIQGFDFADHFVKSDLKKIMDKNLDQDGVLRPCADLLELKFKQQFASTSRTQFDMLCRRFFRMYWRTATYNLTRLMISMMLGALLGIIYQSTDYSTFTGINAGVGLVFISTVFLGIIGFNSVMPVAAEERTAFYREQASETYHALCVGFTGFTTFIYYWLVVSLNALLFVYLGQLLVFALPTVAVASTAGALLSSIFMLFAGFNPPANNIPTGYKWIYYISPPTYTIAALVALIFADCPDGETDGLSCQTTPPTVGSITLKQYVENAFNMKYDLLPRNVAVLCALIVAFRLLALLSLRYISHLKR
ncbi:unnamed protein product [Phytophthora lilii]|uniref:Unnamed protein product n=1 Tax=Phytophthora lilii TaxID=2077276 RepID=A0A9W6TMX4_9STRA|nr:unnamed protein product [Phytophthora lilii]